MRWGAFFAGVAPGYSLVAFDARGTGESGALDCALPTAGLPSQAVRNRAVARCADTIGSRRDFYGTPDNAADIDAVRQALGVQTIALLGTSYGTKVAVEYAH